MNATGARLPTPISERYYSFHRGADVRPVICLIIALMLLIFTEETHSSVSNLRKNEGLVIKV